MDPDASSELPLPELISSDPNAVQLLEDAQTNLHSSGFTPISKLSSQKSLSPPLSTVSGSTAEEMYTRPNIDIPQQQIADFIWDWSSRPEVTPPFDYESRFQRPKNSKLIYRTDEEGDERDECPIYRFSDIPKFIMSHACSFLVGATLMFLLAKRYTAVSRLLQF